MIYETMKSFFSVAIAKTVSTISKYTVYSDTDLLCTKKLAADKLLSFLIFLGASSTKNELLDFYSIDDNAPDNFAFNQQRARLTPETLQTVFYQFNVSVHTIKILLITDYWPLTVPLSLLSADLVLLLMSILFLVVTLPKVFIVCI